MTPTIPTHWILDQIIAQMPNGTLKNLATGAKPFVAGYLNDRLLDIAPDFVDHDHPGRQRLRRAWRSTSASTRRSTSRRPAQRLHLGRSPPIGVHFNINDTQTDLAFADYPIANIVANNVGVDARRDRQARRSPSTSCRVSYGKVLRVGLDAVIIPAIDPNATNLQELLADQVNCAAVGQAINDALASQFGYGGGAGTWTSACTAGLNYGAQTIYNKICRHRLVGSRVRPHGYGRRLSTRITTARRTRCRRASGPAR